MSNLLKTNEEQMILSACALVGKWETAEELTEDGICDDMEALLAVMECESSYTDFKQKTNISTSQSRLH